MITNSAFYLCGLTLIQAWIDNDMVSKSLDEITHPFSIAHGYTFEVREWIGISYQPKMVNLNSNIL